MSAPGDLDIYRTAQVLIDRHGELAYMWAVKRRDAMRRVGDATGWHVWRRVTTAVVRLLGDDRRGAVH